MKSEQTRARALRRQLTATFYRKNKATFFVTAGAMLLLGGALLAVAWILQQIIDIASGDSVAPLVRMAVSRCSGERDDDLCGAMLYLPRLSAARHEAV